MAQLKCRLRYGQIHAVSNRDPASYLGIWEEVGDFFSTPQAFSLGGYPDSQSYEAVLDLDDTISLIRSVQAASGVNELARTVAADRVGRAKPFEAEIAIRVEGPVGEELRFPAHWIVGVLVQRLFLAMNLARPGSFSLGGAELVDSGWSSRVPLHYVDPIEWAWATANRTEWPSIGHASFLGAWTWLGDLGIDDLVVARTPVERTLINVLKITSPLTDDSDAAFLVVQALEAFFGDGVRGSRGQIRDRLYSVLGEPSTHKSWVGKLYDYRSRIAHGSADVGRPGEWVGEAPEITELRTKHQNLVDRGFGALLAVLQVLIANRSTGFQFTELMEHTPIAL